MSSLPRVGWVEEVGQLLGNLARRIGALELNSHSHRDKKTISVTSGVGNLTLGTGGSSAYDYRYLGGPNVGDKGTLIIGEGRITLGTGFSFSGNPLVTLPSDFNIDTTATAQNRFGIASMNAAGTTTIGIVGWGSATQVLIASLNASTAALSVQNISNTVPGTWAAGNLIVWNAVVPVMRV